MPARRPSIGSILKGRPSYSSSDDDDDDDDEETEVFIGPVTTKELVARAEVFNRSLERSFSPNRTFEIDDPLVDAFDVSSSVDQGLDVNILDCRLLPDVAETDSDRPTTPLSAERQDEITQEALKIAARLKYEIASCGSPSNENPVCSKNPYKSNEIVVVVETIAAVTECPKADMEVLCADIVEKKSESFVSKAAPEALRPSTPSRLPVPTTKRKSQLPVLSSRKRSMAMTE
uniref:Uncharacterized protein n=1 Tax=Plectus sambesii TaxID=2011161 RepID=A0A914XS75_9BILA